MSALSHEPRPTTPGTREAAHSTSRAMRGTRLPAAWATIAGVGRFNVQTGREGEMKKGSAVNRAALDLERRAYAEAVPVVLPKRLRNFSTRPPMLSTDFCVPV